MGVRGGCGWVEDWLGGWRGVAPRREGQLRCCGRLGTHQRDLHTPSAVIAGDRGLHAHPACAEHQRRRQAENPVCPDRHPRNRPPLLQHLLQEGRGRPDPPVREALGGELGVAVRARGKLTLGTGCWLGHQRGPPPSVLLSSETRSPEGLPGFLFERDRQRASPHPPALLTSHAAPASSRPRSWSPS